MKVVHSEIKKRKKMISVLVVENEIAIRRGLVKQMNSLQRDLIVIGECATVEDAVIVAEACRPDLVLIDFKLSDGTGIDFWNQTRHIELKTLIMTIDNDSAIEEIADNGLCHILKPVATKELNALVSRLITPGTDRLLDAIGVKEGYINTSRERLILRLQDGFQVILYDELMYCRSDAGYTHFYLRDGRTFIASKPMKEFEAMLSTSNFVRTHQSYMVNISYIDRYNKKGFLYLKGNKRIPVSIRKKEEFIARLLQL